MGQRDELASINQERMLPGRTQHINGPLEPLRYESVPLLFSGWTAW